MRNAIAEIQMPSQSTAAELKTCERCLYNEAIPLISFSQNGICNYCQEHDQLEREYPTGADGKKVLETMVEKIKSESKNSKYDVVVGVSGGCDSCYLLHLAKSLGLRPLAVHFDNTWNSKTAVKNLRNMLKGLQVDLYTHVVDANEYNQIFKSFILASVPDIESPYDLALATTHYMAAKKFGIKYIFEGHSFRTEGITPPGWFYMDGRYIQSVQKKFGTLPLKTYPNLWLSSWLKWIILDGIKKVRPLYYVDYRKEEVKAMLSRDYGWEWYGGHHMENRTSYFTNNYYLPRKFQRDLRVCEYSALVRSGQVKREEGLRTLSEPKPFDTEILAEIKKRLNFTNAEFENAMSAPLRSFRDYGNYRATFRRLRPLFWFLYKMNYVTKSFYLKYSR